MLKVLIFNNSHNLNSRIYRGNNDPAISWDLKVVSTWNFHKLTDARPVIGYQPPHFKIIPLLLGYPPFLRIPHLPILPTNRLSQVFLFNRNATVKLSFINTIHIKQQHNFGPFIFKVTLKYVLGNIYIYIIHATGS